jgi:hypothetical protein
MTRFVLSAVIYAVLVLTSWIAVVVEGGWYTWIWAVLAPVGLLLLLSDLLPRRGGRI